MASLLNKLGGWKQQSDKPPLKPKAVLLDVNGTLFPPSAAAPAFKELGLSEDLVEVRPHRCHTISAQNLQQPLASPGYMHNAPSQTGMSMPDVLDVQHCVCARTCILTL